MGQVSITNWAGNVTFTPQRLHAPRTVPELQELVASSPRIRALGTRITLAIEPTYDITQDVWLDAPADRVLANYAEIAGAAYSVSLFSDPGTPGRIDQIWLKRRDEPPADGTRWGATPAGEDVHP